MSVGPGHYAVLSALIFAIGVYGVLTRSNVLGTLMALSLLFAAPVIALVGFSAVGGGTTSPPLGQGFAFLAVLGSAAQLAVGVALALLVWRRTGSSDSDDLVEVEG